MNLGITLPGVEPCNKHLLGVWTCVNHLNSMCVSVFLVGKIGKIIVYMSISHMVCGGGKELKYVKCFKQFPALNGAWRELRRWLIWCALFCASLGTPLLVMRGPFSFFHTFCLIGAQKIWKHAWQEGREGWREREGEREETGSEGNTHKYWSKRNF